MVRPLPGCWGSLGGLQLVTIGGWVMVDLGGYYPLLVHIEAICSIGCVLPLVVPESVCLGLPLVSDEKRIVCFSPLGCGLVLRSSLVLPVAFGASGRPEGAGLRPAVRKDRAALPRARRGPAAALGGGTPRTVVLLGWEVWPPSRGTHPHGFGGTASTCGLPPVGLAKGAPANGPPLASSRVGISRVRDIRAWIPYRLVVSCRLPSLCLMC